MENKIDKQPQVAKIRDMKSKSTKRRPSDLVTVDECAAAVGFSRQTIINWIAKGWLEAYPPPPPRKNGRKVSLAAAQRLADY